MREIKFRAKKTDNGKWIYGWLVRFAKKYMIINPKTDYDLFANANDENSSIVSFKTIGQFTGLLDKNGKEIYEGDILNFDDFNFDDGHYGNKNIVVTFNKDFFDEISLIIQETKIQIIGNIYENPEMINQKSEVRDE